MTVEDQIKSIIIQKYKSVRAFTKIIDVPYSTIDSMLKKGIAGTGIQTVLKVCHALNIDVESIESGKIRYSPDINSSSGLNLTESEEQIIKKFRLLDQRGQQAVEDTLNRELKYIIDDKKQLNMSEIASDAIQTIDKISENMFKNQHDSVRKK